MTTTPRLLAEDRPDFERILDEALHDGSLLAALREPGPHLTTAQLRTKVLTAADAVAAAADAEYRHYTGLRDTVLGRPSAAAERYEAAPPDQDRRAPEQPEQGAGLLPALTVLAPILAWSAAAVLLLLGYTLRATSPDLALGRAVVTAGWTALAVGVATLVVGSVGLLLTALRDGAGSPPSRQPQRIPGRDRGTEPVRAPVPGDDRALRDDLAEARLAWHTALRERALLPYLHANLDSEPALPSQPSTSPNPPELLSPGYSPAAFGSPGFTSPGTDRRTDPDGRAPRPAEFSSPGYSPPGFTGPDEV
ncbi:hypothetical protein [Kitasatospora sp. GP82]|uniref:hypothetical protein n=1 Tax=Kitasatospora sp. GP82 TaxID=3035089 RepID=UPI0024738FCE|nr:hypothetical protein [Kitasatospora sp. GP82]MDH6127571.1 hypothetical protein [Kitasatospora sp. GP82]